MFRSLARIFRLQEPVILSVFAGLEPTKEAAKQGVFGLKFS
jgi:hypothetical protein